MIWYNVICFFVVFLRKQKDARVCLWGSLYNVVKRCQHCTTHSVRNGTVPPAELVQALLTVVYLFQKISYFDYVSS